MSPIVQPRLIAQADLARQRDDTPKASQRQCLSPLLVANEIQRAELVLRPPTAPVRDLPCQSGDFLLRKHPMP